MWSLRHIFAWFLPNSRGCLPDFLSPLYTSSLLLVLSAYRSQRLLPSLALDYGKSPRESKLPLRWLMSLAPTVLTFHTLRLLSFCFTRKPSSSCQDPETGFFQVPLSFYWKNEFVLFSIGHVVPVGLARLQAKELRNFHRP